MYKFVLAVVVALVVSWIAVGCAENSSGPGSKGLGVDSEIPQFKAAETPGLRLALLVGVKSYSRDSDIPHLKYADKDMQRLKVVLEQHGYVVRLLVNEQATKNAVLSGLQNFADTLGSKPTNSTVLFAFSGHGFADPDTEKNFLLTYDSYNNDVKGTSLALNEVVERLKASKAQTRLVWIDACRVPPNDSGGKTLSNKVFRPQNAKGSIMLFSSEIGTSSYEDDGVQGGIFSHYLLQGLAGANGKTTDPDGWIDIEQLWKYVNAEVPKHAFRIGKTQRPYFEGKYSGEVWLGRVAEVAPVVTVPVVPDPQQQEQLRIAQELADQDRKKREAAEAALVEAQAEAAEAKRLLAAELKRRQDDLARQRQPRLDFEPEMVDIPAGSFEMGSPSNETGRYGTEGPVHTVHIDALQMGKYEVTNAQFRKFRPGHNSGEDDGHSLNGDNQPVVNVGWADAVAYTEWLAKETGKPYRLPTEAEWEYAARAGTTTARFWGNNPDQACKYANVADETFKSEWSGWTIHNCTDDYKVTAPVGSYSPNPWGLYDMLGNVWEWNQDKWHGNYDGAPTDGSAWESGDSAYRLLRGCSWSHNPDNCRAANRGISTDPSYIYGFRVVFRVAGRAF